MKKSNRKNLKFTLVELLMVISIVIILASMLLPALNTARAAAKRIQCLNNVKNISVGLLGYIYDSNDWLPCHFSSSDYAPAQLLDRGDYLKASTGIWQCPSAEFKSYPYGYLGGKNIHLGYEVCAGYRLSSSWLFSPVKLSQISEPSKTGIVADTKGGSSVDVMYYYGMNYIVSADTKVDCRHYGGFNVLFIGGSASFFKSLNTYKNYKTTQHWYN